MADLTTERLGATASVPEHPGQSTSQEGGPGARRRAPRPAPPPSAAEAEAPEEPSDEAPHILDRMA
jgi:hypothetical protein